jgi:hypothetical protein
MAEYIKARYGVGESTNKMQTWSSKESLGNGIFVYRDVIKKEIDVIGRLENILSPVNSGAKYAWQPAYVGYQELMPDYRDCVDFTFNLIKAKSPQNFKNCGKTYLMYNLQP